MDEAAVSIYEDAYNEAWGKPSSEVEGKPSSEVAVTTLLAKLNDAEEDVKSLRAAGARLLEYWDLPSRDDPGYDFWEPPDGKTTRRILAEFRLSLARTAGCGRPK